MTDINIKEIASSVAEFGYYNKTLDPTLDLFKSIDQLKKEKNSN